MSETIVKSLQNGPQSGVKYPIKMIYCGGWALITVHLI